LLSPSVSSRRVSPSVASRRTPSPSISLGDYFCRGPVCAVPLLCRKHNEDSSNDDAPRSSRKYQRRIVDADDDDLSA
jgi:hypothetical protein